MNKKQKNLQQLMKHEIKTVFILRAVNQLPKNLFVRNFGHFVKCQKVY